MSAFLLCRQPDGALQQVDVLGRSIVSLGVHGTGIITYDLNSLKQVKTFAAGLRNVGFKSSIVSDADFNTLQAVIDQPSSTQQLVSIDATVRSSIAAPTETIELPSHVLSIHRIASDSSKVATTVIITTDGNIYTADWPNRQLTKLSTTGTASQKRRITASTPTSLLTAAQADPGSPAHLKFFTLSSTNQLVQCHAFNAAAPSPTASLQSASLCPSNTVLLWTDGSITVEHLDHTQPLLSQHTTSTFRLAAHAREASETTPAPPTASGKKRKVPEQPNTGPQRPQKAHCAAVSSDQFLALHVGSKAGSLAASYSYVDSHYGCVLSSGTVALEGASSADASSKVALVPVEPAAGRYALQVGSTVYCLELPVPQAGLLSLVGRLAVNSRAAAAAAAAGGGGEAIEPLVEAATAGSAAAQVSVTATPGQLPYQQLAYDKLDSSFTLQPAPEWLQLSASSVPEQLQQELLQVAQAERPAAQQLQRAAAHLQQLAHMHVEVNPAVVAAVCQQMADAQQWQQLSAVVSSKLLRTLVPCPGLLPALAQHHQYQDLAALCCQSVELPASQLVEALQHLLTPASSAEGKQAQQQYCQRVMTQAQAELAGAEAAVQAVAAAAAAGPAAVEQARAAQEFHLRMAKCAAAVVDGFSAREVCMHPLMSTFVDTVEVQAALRRLDNGQVRRLLGYLVKWLDKYNSSLGDELRSVMVSELLVFCTHEQVLEWARMTLDAHLARLALAAGCQRQLARMQEAVQQQLEVANGLLQLRGVTEHMHRQAALPQRAVDHANRYLVELLDLRVA